MNVDLHKHEFLKHIHTRYSLTNCDDIVQTIITIIIKNRTQSTKLKYKNNRETDRQTDRQRIMQCKYT